MEELYALVINGRMFYFSGNITKSKFDLVEELAKQISYISNNADNYCDEFCVLIKKELSIDLTPIKIKAVFRG